MKQHILALGRYALWFGPEASLPTGLEKLPFPVEGHAAAIQKGVRLSATLSDEPFSSDQIRPISIDLPLESSSSFEVDPGLAVLVAPTRWGKTYFTTRGVIPAAYARFTPEGVQAVSYVEPYELTPGVAMTHISDPVQLLLTIARFICEPEQEVLFLDSLRAFVYDASVGGTGEGGVDEYLSVQMTALSNVLAREGKMVFATLNPMIAADNKERYDRMVDKIVASVPLVIVGRQPKVVDIFQRGVSAPQRSVMNAHVRDLTTAVIAIESAAPRKHSGTIDTELVDAVIPNSAAHRLIQASIAADPANSNANFDVLPNLYKD